jgi:CHASE3 domain sensor protein
MNTRRSIRTRSLGGFALVVVYFVIVQGLRLLLSIGTDAGYATFPTSRRSSAV